MSEQVRMATDRQPTHPDLISVEKGVGEFSARAVSLQSLPAGALFAKITGSTRTGQRTYASVQTGESSDIELNSDLVYSNHSCDPSTVFDMAKMEVRVVEGRPLEKGQDITFFYPSTEWDMAQPFECNCGAGNGVCIGTVRGAKYLSDEVLRRYWLNPHIERQVSQMRTNK